MNYFELALPKTDTVTYSLVIITAATLLGEHQYELMDSVAAKFHEEPGVFKLMVSKLKQNYHTGINTEFVLHA